MGDGLEVLAPSKSITVNIGGADHVIEPVKMGALQRFGEEAKKVMPVIAALLNAAEDKDGELAYMVAENAEDLIRFASAGTGISEEELRKSDPNDCIVMLVALVRLNMDFFVRRLRQMSQAAAEQSQQGQESQSAG